MARDAPESQERSEAWTGGRAQGGVERAGAPQPAGRGGGDGSAG